MRVYGGLAGSWQKLVAGADRSPALPLRDRFPLSPDTTTSLDRPVALLQREGVGWGGLWGKESRGDPTSIEGGRTFLTARPAKKEGGEETSGCVCVEENVSGMSSESPDDAADSTYTSSVSHLAYVFATLILFAYDSRLVRDAKRLRWFALKMILIRKRATYSVWRRLERLA